MIKVIVGEKGSGKTKALLDSVKTALAKDNGSVVFINNNKRHVLDLNYKIRMIDTSEFEISVFDELYGLICGVISQDYDTTDIFVDSITKIADGSDEEIAAFLDKVAVIAEKNNIEVLMTLSKSADAIGEGVKKYV